ILGPQTPMRCCGATSGAAKIDFQQEGTRVTGLLDAPGVRGTIEARVRGATLSGVLRYRAGSTAGDLSIDATVDGNEMLATMLDSSGCYVTCLLRTMPDPRRQSCPSLGIIGPPPIFTGKQPRKISATISRWWPGRV